jgi:hypothetical protein
MMLSERLSTRDSANPIIKFELSLTQCEASLADLIMMGLDHDQICGAMGWRRITLQKYLRCLGNKFGLHGSYRNGTLLYSLTVRLWQHRLLVAGIDPLSLSGYYGYKY